jgi:hypothetical protein
LQAAETIEQVQIAKNALKLSDIRADPFSQDWLETVKKGSIHLYGTGLAFFCRHWLTTPEELSKMPRDTWDKHPKSC